MPDDDDTIPAPALDLGVAPGSFDPVAWHAANVGVGGASDRAAALYFPNDQRAWALSYLRGWTPPGGRPTKPSTCAIYGSRYMASRGCVHPMLAKGYQQQIGLAPAIVETVAKACAAWTTDRDLLSEFPAPGDILRIGGLGVGQLHIVCVTGSDAATGAVISVDGGQSDGTFVQRCSRVMLIADDGAPWLVKPDMPRIAGKPNGRQITARVLASRLP